MVLDFDFILKNGLKGYINLINSRPEKNELHKAMEMVLNSIDELSRRYSPQIASRLHGDFQRLTFVGNDIRVLKNRGL